MLKSLCKLMRNKDNLMLKNLYKLIKSKNRLLKSLRKLIY